MNADASEMFALQPISNIRRAHVSQTWSRVLQKTMAKASRHLLDEWRSLRDGRCSDHAA
jgi:hypothetical protein